MPPPSMRRIIEGSILGGVRATFTIDEDVATQLGELRERVVKALEKVGFAVARISGSHRIMRHPDGRGTTVPVMRDAISRKERSGGSSPMSA